MNALHADDGEDYDVDGNTTPPLSRTESVRPACSVSPYALLDKPRSRFGKGFAAAALATIAECDQAIAEIDAEIAEIDGQLQGAKADPFGCDQHWLVRARMAARGRRSHRNAIYARRTALLPLRGEDDRKPVTVVDHPPVPPSRFPDGFDPDSLATADDCARAMWDIDAELGPLRALLQSADLRLRTERVGAPHQWLLHVRTESRRLGALRQRVQDRRGQLGKAARSAAADERDARWSHRFISAARASLPAETFEGLCRLADAQGDAG